LRRRRFSTPGGNYFELKSLAQQAQKYRHRKATSPAELNAAHPGNQLLGINYRREQVSSSKKNKTGTYWAHPVWITADRGPHQAGERIGSGKDGFGSWLQPRGVEAASRVNI
jgi:hypothetical protein